ncbi:hypothetical protein EV644_12742 [Kribbella orskensis]|uniref:Site-specific recombinase XerD n=1 Tax=Kribbella orskensis TaxID=2512216 RepID=A0ABY2B9D4_9ACTN|nr:MULTISPECIES: hypothetical protein [Kribbella]TCN32132.1 hypothetical protein EV642_12842 [Kribbella sp. VKM Ac-2500]TCO12151.1 hypothetical protein EV644_12742 [Kribbella orskensis]
MLTEQFAGASSQLSPQAQIVTDALAASRRPHSVMQWLAQPTGGAEVLRTAYRRGEDVTHEFLDQYHGRTVWSLRRTLVDIGVLPSRVETLAQLEVRITTITKELPASQRRILLTYGTWWVLRHAQRQHERTGRFTSSQLRGAQHRLTAAAHLLGWLDAHHLTLEQLSQPHLECWIEDYPLWQHVADFLRWTRRRGITRHELRLPPRVTQDPEIVLSDADRWELLSRCLHDGDLAVDLRAAGALLLLYGFQLTRIVELTNEHLTPTGRRPTLTSPVIAVPPSMRRLLDQLPAPPRDPSALALISAPTNGGHSWLFPGRSTKGHINASVLSTHLRQQGISVRASRNAALIALAADLPASVVVSLFGLNITTALQWARRAGRDWNAFVAATAELR